MQKESASDIELSLKKRARRRLVGAIALVLLMVIFLPVLLKDRTGNAPQDDVQITMASDNEQVLSMPDVQESNSDFDSKVVPAESVTVPPTDSTGVAPSATVAAEQAPISAPSPEPEPAPPVVKDEPLPAKADSTVIEKETPKEVLKSEKETVVPASVNGKFFVQVGVFSDPNNVKQLQAKLRELGYQSRTEKISTAKGEKIRLRSQPFASRGDAASALDKIKEAGLTGMVVTQ